MFMNSPNFDPLHISQNWIKLTPRRTSWLFAVKYMNIPAADIFIPLAPLLTWININPSMDE